MDRKTLTALKKSIKHWEENVEKAKNDELTICDILGNNCPLCEMFSTINSCEGCPITSKTGKMFCRDTPWFLVLNAIEFETALVTPCKKELAFLKSLLPSKKR